MLGCMNHFPRMPTHSPLRGFRRLPPHRTSPKRAFFLVEGESMPPHSGRGFRLSLRLLGTFLLCRALVSFGICAEPEAAALPAGVAAVWDAGMAYRETTPTRERICLNGLWRWQPAEPRSEA